MEHTEHDERAESPMIEKKTHTVFGETLGETETHYGPNGEIVFQRIVDFESGAINEVKYVRDGNILREEIWTDQEGRVCRYGYEQDPRVLEKRILLEKDPDFQDVDF